MEDKLKLQQAVKDVPLKSLKPFENFPFKVRDDEEMADLVSSVKEYGVVTPLIVVPDDDGRFEIISGHRRKRACELAGIEKVPVLIQHISREDATILMVESNLHRAFILPSERAKAYKMRNEAEKQKRGRKSQEKESYAEISRTIDKIAEDTGESASTVQRYIRLCNLIPEIMDMVDAKKLGVMTGTLLASIPQEEQKTVLTSIETEGAPSVSQAQKIKQLSDKGQFTEDAVFEIMCRPKKAESFNVVIPIEKLKKYFPKAVSPKEIEEKLLALCERLYQQQLAKKRANER